MTMRRSVGLTTDCDVSRIRHGLDLPEKLLHEAEDGDLDFPWKPCFACLHIEVDGYLRPLSKARRETSTVVS